MLTLVFDERIQVFELVITGRRSVSLTGTDRFMKKTRLKSVLNLAETRENTAAMDFIKARKNWAANQVQLEQLRTFRSDYQTETSVSQSARDFQSTRVFLSQLSDVIDQQEKQVVEAID